MTESNERRRRHRREPARRPTFATSGDVVDGCVERGRSAAPAARRSGSAARAPTRRQRLRVRRAHSASELDAFVVGYEVASGYRVDLDFLGRAQPFVAVRAGHVVGGFVLNVSPPFRTEVRLPESEQRRLSHEFPAADTVELTCVWLTRQVRSRSASAVLWSSLVWHATRQRRARVVFGTEMDGLRRLYERTGPTLLYEGAVTVDGQRGHGWVYSIAVNRWPVALLGLLRWRRER